MKLALARHITALALMATPAAAAGADLYVDATLSADCIGQYEPSTRACAGGSAPAYRQLSGAAAAAQPGDTVWVRAGIFQQVLRPARAGTPGMPITYRAYASEQPEITGTNEPALALTAVSHVTVEGLNVHDVLGWGRIEDAADITIRGNIFTNATATGTTGGMKLVRAMRVQLVGNTFDDGNDNVVIQESDRNLVRDNTFSKGRHSLLSLRCGNYNVIAGNRFSNPDQKAMEIYDCEGTSDAPVRLDATKRNLVDGNVVSLTLMSDRNHRYNGIQYAGQQGIVRRNVFYENHGGGVNFQVYSDEALNNYQNHVYNNTFAHNQCNALAASNRDDPARYWGNVAINNLMFDNTDCAGGAAQTAIGNTVAVVLDSNTETTSNPGFSDDAGRDYTLTQQSAVRDAARFATTAVGSGSGTVLTVSDPLFFFDGFQVPGVEGDTIQVEGHSETSRVTSINETTGELTLTTPLTWADGNGVHLSYAGTAPDMGAFEFTLAGGSSSSSGGTSSSSSNSASSSAASSGPSSGAGSSSAAASGASGGTSPGGSDADGCSCRQSGARASGWRLMLMAGALLLRRRTGAVARG